MDSGGPGTAQTKEGVSAGPLSCSGGGSSIPTVGEQMWVLLEQPHRTVHASVNSACDCGEVDGLCVPWGGVGVAADPDHSPDAPLSVPLPWPWVPRPACAVQQAACDGRPAILGLAEQAPQRAFCLRSPCRLDLRSDLFDQKDKVFVGIGSFSDEVDFHIKTILEQFRTVETAGFPPHPAPLADAPR